MKAAFYSFFSVLRYAKPFIVYGLAWAVIGIFMPVIVSSIVAMLIGSTGVATMLILMPLSVIMTVAMYCSFYASYVHVFGEPEATSAQQPSQTPP